MNNDALNRLICPPLFGKQIQENSALVCAASVQVDEALEHLVSRGGISPESESFSAVRWMQEWLARCEDVDTMNAAAARGGPFPSRLYGVLPGPLRWHLFPALAATEAMFGQLIVGGIDLSARLADSFVYSIKECCNHLHPDEVSTTGYLDSFDVNNYLSSCFHPSLQSLIVLALVQQRSSDHGGSRKSVADRWPACVQRLIGRRDLIETAATVRTSNRFSLKSETMLITEDASEQTIPASQRAQINFSGAGNNILRGLVKDRDTAASEQAASGGGMGSVSGSAGPQSSSVVDDRDGLMEAERLGLLIFAEDDRMHEVGDLQILFGFLRVYLKV
jgi:hypothetical protein